MLQEEFTKDVFRQLDGFLILMSDLSGIAGSNSSEIPRDEVLADVLDMTRLVFIILSEAMHEHSANTEYFIVSSLLFNHRMY